MDKYEYTDDGQDEGQGVFSGMLPSYMVASGNHNTGNLNSNWEEANPDATLGTKIYNFTGSSIMSGINGFRNTGIAVSNWFTEEQKDLVDTRDMIAGFDENMAMYYEENRQAIDLVGFVATSFIPGTAGVRVFNAGARALRAAEGGVFGANMARGLGVLPGARQTLVAQAAQQYATSRTAFTLTNANTVKAMAAGFAENVLQSAAFETAVAATMFKSPILEDMDFGDLIGNIVTGALVGGAIGGTIDAARSVSQIKKGIRELDKKLVPVTQLARGADGTSASDSILLTRNDLDTFARNAPEGVDPTLYSNLVEDKLRAAEVETRAQWSKLAKGDEELAQTLHMSTANDSSQQLAAKVLNLVEVDSVGDAISTVQKAAKNLDEGAPNPVSVSYLTVFGDDLGKVADTHSPTLSIADNLKAGQKVEVTANTVTYGNRSTKINPTRELHDPSKGNVADAEARHMWANDPAVPPLQRTWDEAKKRSQNPQARMQIHVNDVALLGKAYREGFTEFDLVRPRAAEIDPITGARTEVPPTVISTSTWTREKHLEYIAQRKDRLSASMGKRYLTAEDGTMNLDAIAKRLDVTTDWLMGTKVSTSLEDNMFGLRSQRQQWYNRIHANTPQPPDIESLTPWKSRQTVALVYDQSRLAGVDTYQMEAMTVIKQRQKLQETANQAAAAKTLGDRHNLLPTWDNNLLGGADRMGSGPTFISYANGNYGSLASFAEYVGSLVTKWTNETTNKVTDMFAAVNHKIVNSSEASAELATVMTKVRAAGTQKYVLDPDNPRQLVLKSYVEHQKRLAGLADDAIDEMPEFIVPSGIDLHIPMSDGVAEWAAAHITANGARLQSFKNMKGAQGLDNNVDPAVFYPPAPNPNRFTHHAFVVDDSVRDTGHVSMLYAVDAKNLESQIAEARAQGFTVLTKSDTAAYYRARGEYDYSKGFNENYIDAAMSRSGSSAAHFPITGKPEEMMQDWMQWHVQQENIVIRDAVKLNYSRQMGTINKMSEAYDSVQTSTRTGFFDRFQSQVKNPYQDYIKTMLGVSRQSEYPIWKGINDSIDRAGSALWGAVSDIFSSAKSPYDLEQTNALFNRYGLKVAATEAQLQAWANHPAGQGAVSRFISQQNAILSALTLRLDPVNALNNAAGSTILTGAETASVLRAIRSGNSEAVGELSQLMNIQLPGTGDLVKSPAKLIASAYADILGDGGAALIQKYKGQNLVVDQVQQFRNLLETVTIDGTETAAQLDSKMAKAFAMAKTFADKGEKWTGNKFAEQLNRAVSARIMDKITDVAVRAGVMDTKTAGTYINTFVNRTQANIIASQRPQMFQGPLGQAVGLFQSYQFNIMQQLLRHVGEGSAKDAMTLLGMQATVYGASGLPAFQAINTHIIGNASGNPEHRDLYTAINGIAGKSVGDWFTYGLASNMFIHPDLKINLYSRGDINPRSVTVVPTNLADIPVAGAWARAFQSAKGTLTNIQNGGDVWNSLLTGIEQQGISRPMKGLAQVMRGIGDGGMSFSQSGQGNIVSSNDFLSLANLSRISGAKPFDEAVSQDALYRLQTYQAKDRSQRDALGKAIKTIVAGGGTPSQDEMESFMDKYAQIGGTQMEFTRWYTGIVKTARTPQVNKIVENVSSPYSAYMQEIMGGRVYNTPTIRPQTQDQIGE